MSVHKYIDGKMSKSYFKMSIVLSLLYLLSLHSFAQDNKNIAQKSAYEHDSLRLAGVIMNPDTTEQVCGIYYLPVSGEFAWFYREPADSNTLQNGRFQGMKIPQYRSGIIFQGGTKIQLESDFIEIMAFNDDHLIYLKRDPDLNTAVIKKYLVHNHSLSFDKQISFPWFELNIYPVKDLLIVSDEYEGMGTFADIYDSNLELKKRIKPFGNYGFTWSNVFKDGGKIRDCSKKCVKKFIIND